MAVPLDSERTVFSLASLLSSFPLAVMIMNSYLMLAFLRCLAGKKERGPHSARENHGRGGEHHERGCGLSGTGSEFLLHAPFMIPEVGEISKEKAHAHDQQDVG